MYSTLNTAKRCFIVKQRFAVFKVEYLIYMYIDTETDSHIVIIILYVAVA